MSYRNSILCMALALGYVAGFNQASQASPKLRIGEEQFDFGYTMEGYPVMHRFWVYNTGDQPLKIERVRPSCGCTTVPLTKNVLEPGDSVGLELKFDTRRFKGQITKTASVETNDKSQPNAKLAFTANVGKWEGAVIANPSVASLDTLGKSSQVIALKNTSPNAYTISVVSPAPDFMSSSLSANELPPMGEVALTLSATANAPIGEYNASITLHLEGPVPHNITIPVYGIGYIE